MCQSWDTVDIEVLSALNDMEKPKKAELAISNSQLRELNLPIFSRKMTKNGNLGRGTGGPWPEWARVVALVEQIRKGLYTPDKDTIEVKNKTKHEWV